MKIILSRVFPQEIAEIIYNFYINDFVKIKLFGKMFHLENLLNGFILKYNNLIKNMVYLNDYNLLNNIMNVSTDIFKYYDIIKNCNIDNNFREYFDLLIKYIKNTNDIININIKHETNPVLAYHGSKIWEKLNLLIKNE
jgi:hypothetical protein